VARQFTGLCGSSSRTPIIILIIIQFNYCLFTCKLNSPEANCKVSTSKKTETTAKLKQNTKQGNLYSNISNDSIQFLFICLSRAQGPITESARVKERKQAYTIVIIIIIIMPVIKISRNRQTDSAEANIVLCKPKC
jgi:hypothetical protein